MSDLEGKILEELKEQLPVMSEKQRYWLLGYIEGTAEKYKRKLEREEEREEEED